MKITLDLPDELVKQVKLRAVHDEQKLKDAVASILRAGLFASEKKAPTLIKVDKRVLARRRELTRKFTSGEWGVEIPEFEVNRETDRQAASKRAKAWRD